MTAAGSFPAAVFQKENCMGNWIVGLFVLAIVALVIRALRKEHKENGSCAFCSYAKGGKCDHVGHEELDHGKMPALTAEEQAILDRHTKKR